MGGGKEFALLLPGLDLKITISFLRWSWMMGKSLQAWGWWERDCSAFLRIFHRGSFEDLRFLSYLPPGWGLRSVINFHFIPLGAIPCWTCGKPIFFHILNDFCFEQPCFKFVCFFEYCLINRHAVLHNPFRLYIRRKTCMNSSMVVPSFSLKWTILVVAHEKIQRKHGPFDVRVRFIFTSYL